MSEDHETPFTWEHEGRTIRLEKWSGTFDVDEGKNFDTLAAAKQSVERMNVAQRRRAQRELSLPVVLSTGRHATIRGLHLGHGALLFKEKEVIERFHSAEIYPDIGWIEATLEELRKQRAVVTELWDRVHPYVIDLRSRRHVDEEVGPDLLEKQYNELRKSAEESDEAKAWEPTS